MLIFVFLQSIACRIGSISPISLNFHVVKIMYTVDAHVLGESPFMPSFRPHSGLR